MILDDILDIASAVCLLLGAFLSLAAGVGLLRFPDALSRLHAATKPQILGLLFVVLAVALDARSWSTMLALLPVLLFQVLTAPISAHMVGRAGYRTRNFRRDLLLVDDLEEAVERATRESEAEIATGSEEGGLAVKDAHRGDAPVKEEPRENQPKQRDRP